MGRLSRAPGVLADELRRTRLLSATASEPWRDPQGTSRMLLRASGFACNHHPPRTAIVRNRLRLTVVPCVRHKPTSALATRSLANSRCYLAPRSRLRDVRFSEGRNGPPEDTDLERNSLACPAIKHCAICWHRSA